MPPDKTPRDLEKSSKALFQDYNPNDPEIHRSLTVAHNRYINEKQLFHSGVTYVCITGKS